MPDVDVAGFTVPNWRHGGTTCKLRLYSTETWTDFDGVPHLSGILGSPQDFYQEIPCTITGTVVNVPPFTTPPTINSPTYRNVRVTGIFVDEKETVIEPPLFEDWIIPTYSPTTWFKLAVFNSSPNAPLGDRFVTIDALLALLIGEGTGLLDGVVPVLDQDNVFTGDNVFEGDVTAGRLITPLVLGGTLPTDSLTLRATSGAGQPGSEIHFQVGNNGSIEALTIHSDGSMLAKDLTSDNLAARGFSLIGSVSNNKLTFLANPNTTAYTLKWPIGNGIGVLTNDGSGNLTWEPAGSGGGGPTGPTTGTGAFVLQDMPTINSPIINNAQMFNPDIGNAHGASLILSNNVGMQLRLSNGGANYAEFTEDALGVLNYYSAGAHFNPQTGLRESLGDVNKKWLTVEAGELHVQTLVAQSTIATIGGRILVGPTTMLMADLPAGGTFNTITVKHNQIRQGDIVILQARGLLEYMSVSSVARPNGANFDYDVARNQDGSGRDAWFAGDAVFNTGQFNSDGFIDIYSQFGLGQPAGPGMKGPTIVGNVRNSAQLQDWSEHWAVGNLNGLYGVPGIVGAPNVWGIGLGKYSSSSAYVIIDDTNGYQMYGGGSGAPIIQLRNNGSGYLANDQISWDQSGVLTVANKAFIAGWQITPNAIIKEATASTSAGLSPTDYPFYAGALFANRATAPFRVRNDGAFWATNATIQGNITATSGSFTGTVNASAGTIAGWAINPTSFVKNEVRLAAGVDITNSAGAAEVWLGKSGTGYSGLFVKGNTSAYISLFTNPNVNTGARPYLAFTDATPNFRVVIGELNYAWGSDGPSPSVGMKIWNQSLQRIVEFSDTRNQIAGWDITTASISSTGISLTSGANANLTAGSGSVILDATGLNLTTGASSSPDGGWAIRWRSGANVISKISNYNFSGTSVGGHADQQYVLEQTLMGTGAAYDRQLLFLNAQNKAGTYYARLFLEAVDQEYAQAYITGTPNFGLLVGGAPPSGASAMLHVKANAAGKAGYFEGSVEINTTTGALLPSRLTTAQRDALAASDGMMVYNTTSTTLQARTAGKWRDVVTQVAAKVSNSAATFPVPSGTTTPINFDSAWFDSDAMHTNAAMPRLTCKIAGMYLIQGALTIAADGAGAGIRQLQLKLNGATLIDSDLDNKPPATVASCLAADSIWPLNVGDWVELHVYQSSGVALAINGTNGGTDISGVYLSMVKVG